MGVQSHVARWGNSLAVRIPKVVAEQWGVREGSCVELDPRDDRLVMRRKTPDLSDMVARMTPESLHTEVETGPAQGREEW